MDKQRIAPAEFVAHLADGFGERLRLDVAHRTADLANHHVNVARNLVRRRLDLVGDVRDHLDGLAKIVAATFLLDDAFVDSSRREVVVLGEVGVSEALVVAEVEVGFGPVVGDEDLAMLKRAHRAGIDVQVRVKLLHVDPQATAFKQAADGCGGDPLAKG